MLIHKRSQLTGKLNKMDINVTKRQLDDWITGDKCIQDAFPNLTPDEREFLMTGATCEEWDAACPDDEE